MNPTSPLPQLPMQQYLSAQTSYPYQYNQYNQQQLRSDYQQPQLPQANYHHPGQYVDHHDDHFDTHYNNNYRQPHQPQQNTQPQYNTQPRYNTNYSQSNNQPIQQNCQQSHVKQESAYQPTNLSLPSSMTNQLPAPSNMVNNSFGMSNSLPVASNNQTINRSVSSNMGSSYGMLSQQQNLQNMYQRIVTSNPTYAMGNNGQVRASNLVTQAYRYANQPIPSSVSNNPPPAPKKVKSLDGRRTRNLKSPHALKVLKFSFSINRKPGKDTMRALQRDTGCAYGDICRWFRNERHKEKRLHNNQLFQVQLRQAAPTMNQLPVESRQSTPSSSEVDESSRATSPGSRNSGCSSSSACPQTPTSGSVVSDLRNFLGTPDVINQSINQIVPEATPSYDQQPQFTEWISNFNHSYEEEQQQAAMAATLMQQQQQSAHYEH